ncbi:MAG TPA: sigma-54 dependent transcriptional regulator [Planctomycetota bacterium]|nr:sigma-54 dependent transcriptional regulator [Planctomycetota bacterium]
MPKMTNTPLTSKYAMVPALSAVVEVCDAISAALWDRTDGREAWAMAERLEFGAEVPADLLIALFTDWGQLATKLGRLPDAQVLLGRARSALPDGATPEMVNCVATLEGLLAAWRGDLMRREAIYRESGRTLSPGSREHLRHRISHAHFLATMGRESEVDAELGALEGLDQRSSEMVLLVRFIQAVETGRFAAAWAMAGTLRRFTWDISGHRAFFLEFLDLAAGRWRLPGLEGSDGPPSVAGQEGGPLPAWAQIMDDLLAGRPERALEVAKREAGGDLVGCVTKTGSDSFNLIRAELANGNWQAAVRLVGMRRARGNRHYLDDYFMAAACLLAGQRADAAAHFARVERACAQYDAAGRLEFELRMACAFRPADVYWLTRMAGSPAARSSRLARRNTGIAEAQGAPPAPSVQAQPPAEPRGLMRLVGPGEAMTAVRDAVLRCAQLEAPVLITGETGTGKELAARAMHECGPRAGEPFLAVNCGAIAETLLESELFGHERGAFTGAAGAHRGLFEAAGRGSILLDEIGEIPLRLQVGLLRVLESGEIRPVGSSRSRRIGCRIIAATNADIAGLAAEGRFRKDLYYRLARLTVRMPPLRERPEDIVPLALHFLAEARADGAKPALSAELEEALRRAAWPGNVRELRNAVERMRLYGSEKLGYGLADWAGPEPVTLSRPLGKPLPAAVAAAEAGGGARQVRAADDVEGFLRGGRTALRRLERLRELFARHRRLTRAEVAAILEVAPKTATADLRALCRIGFIEKVEPGASRRTHYFALREPSGSGG